MRLDLKRYRTERRRWALRWAGVILLLIAVDIVLEALMRWVTGPGRAERNPRHP